MRMCATTSRSPVFDGRSVDPGTHINGVGSHTPDVRELDSVTIQRSMVVVDSRNAALAEAGDLVIPMREGIVASNHIWAELGEVLIGKRPGRINDQEVTVFKSVGIAIQDATVGCLAFNRARKGLEFRSNHSKTIIHYVLHPSQQASQAYAEALM